MASARVASRRNFTEAIVKIAKDPIEEEKSAWTYADGSENLAANNTTIKCGDLAEYLQNSVQLSEGWKSLPLTVYFFAIFVISLLLHTQPKIVLQSESAITSVITSATYEGTHSSESTLSDVTEITQFWPWVRDALVPVVWNQVNSAGEALPVSEWGRIATYNKVVGCVTFEQTRSKKADCTVPTLEKIANDTCHPKGTHATESYLPDVDLSRFSEEFQLTINQSFVAADSGNYEVWLQALSPINIVLDQVNLLDQMNWVDKFTDTVLLRTIIYNGELSLLSQVRLLFTFERGGMISTTLTLQTIPVDFYSNKFLIAVDVLWIFSLTVLMISEIVDIYKFRASIVKDYLSDHWNILDWACIAWGYAISFIFVQIVVDVNASVRDLQHIPPFGDSSYFPYIRNMANDLEVKLALADTWRVLAGSNIFLIMCRFFKSFRQQPRLNIVTRTLRVASVDFIHFFLIFITIWFCYVCSGYYLFGKEVEDFSTLAQTGQVCLLILLGEADFWDEIRDTNSALAPLWFWTYVILVFLVLLNMLIAVLIDTYAQVKSSVSASAPTLWSQTYDAITAQRKSLRGSVTYTDIIAELQKRERDVLVTPELLSKWTKTDVNVAKSMITSALRFQNSALRRKGGVSLSDAMKQIRRLDESFGTAKERLLNFEAELLKQEEVLKDIDMLVGRILEIRGAPRIRKSSVTEQTNLAT